MDVTFFGGEFRFQPETRGNSRGQGSTKLDPKTIRGGNPASTFGREEDNSKHQKSPSPTTFREPRGR
jgi:hypothetical protein